MTDFETKMKVLFVKLYYQRGESVAEAMRGLRSAERNLKLTTEHYFRKLIARFEEHFTFEDRRKDNKAKNTTTTDENIAKVKELFEENPKLSISKASQQLAMNRESLRLVLKKVLMLHPYKISSVQKLNPEAKIKRKEFCEQMLGLIDGECALVEKIIFTDEAHFWGDGYVNNQNYRFWSSSNPHLTIDKSLHPYRVTARAAFSMQGILLKFIEGNVNSAKYLDLLKNTWKPFAEENDVITAYWFQQNEATAHCTKEVLKLLHEGYGERVISRRFTDFANAGIDWPPYSPDLT